MVAKEFLFDINAITSVMICSIYNIFLGIRDPKFPCSEYSSRAGKSVKKMIKYFTFFSHDLLLKLMNFKADFYKTIKI